jgi:hypothetical protein
MSVNGLHAKNCGPEFSRGSRRYCVPRRLALASKLVRRDFRIISLVLVASVLGSFQCVEFCSLLSADRQAGAPQVAEPEMPCHQQSSENSPVPNDESCSHREMVAEKRSSDSYQLVTLSFAVVASAIPFDAPLHERLPVSPAENIFHTLHPLAMASILRI